MSLGASSYHSAPKWFTLKLRTPRLETGIGSAGMKEMVFSESGSVMWNPRSEKFPGMLAVRERYQAGISVDNVSDSEDINPRVSNAAGIALIVISEGAKVHERGSRSRRVFSQRVRPGADGFSFLGWVVSGSVVKVRCAKCFVGSMPGGISSSMISDVLSGETVISIL